MSTIFHNKRTIIRIGRQLQQMANNHIALDDAFNIVARKAHTVEEMVVIEVMREAYEEMAASALGSTRSARMPAMALSR